MLKNVKILKDAEPVALERLQQACTVRKFPARALIVEVAEPTADVFFIQSGQVRAIIYAPNGKAVLFRGLGPGDVLGEISALDGKPRSASVEALEASTVARVPAEAFRAFVASQPAVAMALLLQTIGYVRELTERVYAFGSLTVSHRIHAELLRQVLETNPVANIAVIDPAPRQADIADRISTHREAVSRELSNLARIGLLRRKGRALVINDVAALQRLVGDAAHR